MCPYSGKYWRETRLKSAQWASTYDLNQNAVLGMSFPTQGQGVSFQPKNILFPTQGAQFWLKKSYLQPRGQGAEFRSNMGNLQV